MQYTGTSSQDRTHSPSQCCKGSCFVPTSGQISSPPTLDVQTRSEAFHSSTQFNQHTVHSNSMPSYRRGASAQAGKRLFQHLSQARQRSAVPPYTYPLLLCTVLPETAYLTSRTTLNSHLRSSLFDRDHFIEQTPGSDLYAVRPLCVPES